MFVTEIRFLQRKKPGRDDFIDLSLPGYDGAKHRNVNYGMAMEVMHVIDDKGEIIVCQPVRIILEGFCGSDHV